MKLIKWFKVFCVIIFLVSMALLCFILIEVMGLKKSFDDVRYDINQQRYDLSRVESQIRRIEKDMDGFNDLMAVGANFELRFDSIDLSIEALNRDVTTYSDSLDLKMDSVESSTRWLNVEISEISSLLRRQKLLSAIQTK